MNQEPDAAPVLPSTCVLYLGDCLTVMPSLAPNSIAMAYADMPYGITHQKWDEKIDLVTFWNTAKQAFTSHCTSIFSANQPFATDIITSNRHDFRYELIWQKTNPVGFLNANCRPLNIHENILIFSLATCNPMSAKKMTYNAQKTVGLPYRKGVYAQNSNNYDVRNSGGTSNESGMRHPLSILPVTRCASRLHPTQKPVVLLEWLIKTYTNPGDTVLDPTFGSCTTGVACARLGRNFVGIEKDSEYFRIGRERVDAERSRLGLQPSQAGTASTSHASKTSP